MWTVERGRDADEKTAEDKVKELRLQVYALRDRVNRLWARIHR